MTDEINGFAIAPSSYPAETRLPGQGMCARMDSDFAANPVPIRH